MRKDVIKIYFRLVISEFCRVSKADKKFVHKTPFVAATTEKKGKQVVMIHSNTMYDNVK